MAPGWRTIALALLAAALLGIHGRAVFLIVVGVSRAQLFRPLGRIALDALGPALALYGGALCALVLPQALRGRREAAAPQVWEGAAWGVAGVVACLARGQPLLALGALLAPLAAAVFEPRPRWRRRIDWLCLDAGAAAASIALALPLLWVLVASLRAPGGPQPAGLEWWPHSPSLASYARLGELLPLGRELANSLLVAGVGVTGALLVASGAAFALLRAPAPLRRAVLALSAAGLAVPPMALWLTRFLVFRWLGLLNTPLALLAPALLGGSPISVLVLYLAFRRVPTALWDQARLDGAAPIGLWWRIGLPLVRRPLVALAALVFGGFWGNVTDPTLYLSDATWQTLPVGLQSLYQLNPSNWPVLMAGAAVMALPCVAVFALARRAVLGAPALAPHETHKE